MHLNVRGALLASALCFAASAASAGTCSGPYSGNTSGTDSDAMRRALNDICGSTASPPGPSVYTSTPVGASVVTHGTFQAALAANASRHGCTIQNTSSDLLYVEPIATVSATAAASFLLQPGWTFACGANGGVLTDNISITSSSQDGAPYVVNSW